MGWDCRFNQFTGGEVVGGGFVRINCSSDCVNNKYRHVHLNATVYGFTFGWPVSVTTNRARLEDGTAEPSGANLAGKLTIKSLGIWFGPGVGNTEYTLGRARSIPTSFTDSFTKWGGIGAGLDVYSWGDAEVTNETTGCCQ